MEWWIWIAKWFLFCIKCSRLYWIYHKKHETLTPSPAILIYINRINNRLAFKIKNGYKLESQKIETMKLFGSKNKLIEKTKTEENVQSFEAVEVVLV